MKCTALLSSNTSFSTNSLKQYSVHNKKTPFTKFLPKTNMAQERPASFYQGPSVQAMYSRENRDRVHELILQQDPDLKRRVENYDDEDAQCDAEDELWDQAQPVLKKEFEALNSQERQMYEEKQIEAKYNQWRRVRKQGRLIEDEESLAQKAQDDALIAQGFTIDDLIAGKAGSGASCGGGGAFFAGGGKGAVNHSIVAPFCKTESKMENVGLVLSEEEFC